MKRIIWYVFALLFAIAMGLVFVNARPQSEDAFIDTYDQEPVSCESISSIIDCDIVPNEVPGINNSLCASFSFPNECEPAPRMMELRGFPFRVPQANYQQEESWDSKWEAWSNGRKLSMTGINFVLGISLGALISLVIKKRGFLSENNRN